MPRKARVDVQTMFERLKDLPIFNEQGDLLKRTHPIWKEAGKKIPEMSVHNMHIFIHQNRKNLRADLMKYKNIKGPLPPPKKYSTKEEPGSKHNDVWDDYEYYDTLDTEEENVSDFYALISMLNSEQFKDTICKLGVKPFSVLYRQPDQITMWNDLINIESTTSLIVLDNMVSKIVEDFESKNVFVCGLTVKVENSIILLTQMLTDSITSSSIQLFLNSWLESRATAPPEIVVPYSHCLLNATSLTFNVCTMETYNLRCYQYLINETAELPPTLILIDLVGLIKVVDKWQCFDNILQSVKDFYLCSIMYLSTIDKLDDLKKAVVNILTLCQSPYENNETELVRTELWTHLTSDAIQQMNQQYLEFMTGKYGPKSFSFLNMQQEPVVSNESDPVYNFINQLKHEAHDKCDFVLDVEKKPNDYYCPIVLQDLTNLLVEFPSWTQLILKKKKYSTLASVSSTKHLCTLHELKRPVTAPQFLVYHLEKIEKLTSIGRHTVTLAKCRNKYRVKERSNNHAYLSQLISSSRPLCDSRIEISIPEEEMQEMDSDSGNVIDNVQEVNQDDHDMDHDYSNNIDERLDDVELDLVAFKNTLQSTANLLNDLDECVDNLKAHIKQGDEMRVCKALLDSFATMNTYKKAFGMIAEKFCTSSNGFVSAFKKIFVEFYKKVDLQGKSSIENTAKLFAYLLTSNSITWDILSNLKLTIKDTVGTRKIFAEILLKEMSELAGAEKLKRLFKKKNYKSEFKGLFPTGAKDLKFAVTFYKSIGLTELSNLLKPNTKTDGESSTLRRSSSNSSLSSNSSSNDVVIELRVSRKHKKNVGENNKKRKIIVV